MDIRPLTESYAVSPQITPEDLAAVRAAGFTTVIDNRPDREVAEALRGAAMRQAAEAQGLDFVTNPVVARALTMDNVRAQREAIDAAVGPVLAYCASGTRSSIVWALAEAGRRPVDELIALPARHGYRLEEMRSEIEALAQG